MNQAVTDSILDRSKDTKATDDAQIAKLKSEIETIRSLVKELKQQTENGDAEKIKACADQIAQAWETMKDKVNAAYPDMTDFLQKKIDSLNALQTSDPFDSEAMLQLDYELYQAFRQLSDKAGD
ncbi:hypothetical protein [Cohnella rhizosphaerae]|uniref:Uncharacterized protein n=1 Tax=Cohnella rhizosphaerae TaxID=1457232 RepID=A0A9X4KT67_9BACL|nr:hypothetical protein [Cohnella rhizosphaerae]MDG0809776.1 hypothetical protein [Cohnella rhizosphaerae]